MTATTVQPPVGGWFPDRPEDDLPTDRYPEVQRVVDAFVTPTNADQDGGADVAELVAEHFRSRPIAESDTDAGFARLATLLGLMPRTAVA